MIPFVIIIVFSMAYASLIFIDKELSVYYFIPYNYLFDLVFFTTSESLATVSTVIRVVVLLAFFVQLNQERFFNVSKPGFGVFLAVFFILLISSVFSSQNLKSLLETIKFFLIIFSFFSFFIFYSYNLLNIILLKRMVFFLALITIGNILLSNIFSFGWGGYSDNVGFYTGGIISNMWYIPALILLATIAVLNFHQRGTTLLLSIAAILILMILIVALRRSAYIILVISALSALLFLKLNLKVIRIGAVFLVLVGLASLVFLPILERQIVARNKTFDKGVEEESRVKETSVLWTERLEDSSTFKFLLGEKPFNSTGNYGKGSFGDRPLHVDMNIIFFSAGFVGLVLYSMFYISIFIRYVNLSYKIPAKYKDLFVYKYLFFAAFFSLVALSFSGGLNAITFRMFGFFLLAIALGQMNYINATRKTYSRKIIKPYPYEAIMSEPLTDDNEDTYDSFITIKK